MRAEQWATVVGYEGLYEVSDFGRIRSVERVTMAANRWGGIHTRRTKSRVLKLHTWGAQYPGIVLVGADGQRTRRMIHQLVAHAFVPNPQGLPQINHIDADTFNAKASNLEWCNQAQNILHAHRIGTRKTGSSHHFASLPRDQGGHCRSKEQPGGWAMEEL